MGIVFTLKKIHDQERFIKKPAVVVLYVKSYHGSLQNLLEPKMVHFS